MTIRRGPIITVIVIIVGILITIDHTFFLRLIQEYNKNQANIQLNNSENKVGKEAVVIPTPIVSSSPNKPIDTLTNNTTLVNKQAEVKAPSSNKQEPVITSPSSKPQTSYENIFNNQNATNNTAIPLETTHNITNAQTNTTTKVPEVIPKAVEQKAETIAKSEVKTDDLFKVASVLLGKLSLTEIKYLFDSASDNYWELTPVEEIEKARKMLFSKLSAEDLDQLYQLGIKYGRSMTILDPNINVADTKAKRIKYLEEQRSKQQ